MKPESHPEEPHGGHTRKPLGSIVREMMRMMVSKAIPCFFVGGPWNNQIHALPYDTVANGRSWGVAELDDEIILCDNAIGPVIGRLITYTIRPMLDSGMPVYSCLDLSQDAACDEKCRTNRCVPWRLYSVRQWRLDDLVETFKGDKS